MTGDDRASPSFYGIAHLAQKVLSEERASREAGTLECENSHQKTAPYAGYGVKSAQGRSNTMEDAYHVETVGSPAHLLCGDGLGNGSTDDIDSSSVCIPGFPQDLALFSVFDGHGGTEVAQHCSDKLHQHFTQQLTNTATNAAAVLQQQQSQDDPSAALRAMDGTDDNVQPCCSIPEVCTLVSQALRASFLATDRELEGTESGEFVGATAVVAVVSSQHIWVAHCGDSRAVIERGGAAVDLTSDHKPSRADEAERICAAGGRIVFNSGTTRVMGMLAMTRAIGDHYLRPFVIAEPEVRCLERSSDDETMIIATDGLWDVFTSAEATALASRCISRSRERGMSKHGACRVAANVLAKAAMERGSRDNITVICVDIKLGGEAGGIPGAKAMVEEADQPQPPKTPSHVPGGLEASTHLEQKAEVPRQHHQHERQQQQQEPSRHQQGEETSSVQPLQRQQQQQQQQQRQQQGQQGQQGEGEGEGLQNLVGEQLSEEERRESAELERADRRVPPVSPAAGTSMPPLRSSSSSVGKCLFLKSQASQAQAAKPLSSSARLCGSEDNLIGLAEQGKRLSVALEEPGEGDNCQDAAKLQEGLNACSQSVKGSQAENGAMDGTGEGAGYALGVRTRDGEPQLYGQQEHSGAGNDAGAFGSAAAQQLYHAASGDPTLQAMLVGTALVKAAGDKS